MKQTLSYEQALHKAAALCMRSEKCELDICNKLLAWGVNENDATKIISYLTAEKFLDNARFCNFFVKDKVRFNKWGKIKIGYALKAKKIDEALIIAALSQIDEQETVDNLIALLQSKQKNLKYKDEFEKKGKLIRFALSRGFEMNTINQALKKL